MPLTSRVVSSGAVDSAAIADGSIVNADVNASAAIALSKLAAVTASKALVSDGSGFASAATTTSTEIGYVSGVTSAIQTQIDALTAGLDLLTSCVAASTTALTVTYLNGALGVGATLTNAGAQAAISLDGQSPSVNQRVLIKNQASDFQNGIYKVTTVGDGTHNWVLTRVLDYDQAAEVTPGDLIPVTAGTVNAGTFWLQTATVAVMGTDSISFSNFYTPASFLKVASNLSDLNNAGTARSSLGLGTAAVLNVGTSASQIVQLDGSAKLPAVDGSALTNLPSSSPTADLGWFSNLGVVRATTTDANDSIKITSAGGTALSGSNVGKVRLMSGTLGQVVEFSITSDVTLKLTGAHWGADTLGDVTGALLRVLAINDNGTLRWGVALQGGRETVTTTDTNATQTSITTSIGVLCDTAVGSSTNTCRELAYFFADFDDTGGAHENLWAVESAVNAVVVGRSSDGVWGKWQPNFPSGFGTPPTTQMYKFCFIGRTCRLYFEPNAWGTANSNVQNFGAPFKARTDMLCTITRVKDNGTVTTTPGQIHFNAGSLTANVYLDSSGGTAWAGAGSTGYNIDCSYET